MNKTLLKVLPPTAQLSNQPKGSQHHQGNHPHLPLHPRDTLSDPKLSSNEVSIATAG